MNYCSNCGGKVTWRIPPLEDMPRYVCDNCGAIHYENPKMVVGAIPEVNGKILFCRRAIEPRRDKWTLPAGYLENGETISACARREAMEEAWAQLDALEPYALINIPFINQVYFMFRARLVNSDYRAGTESLEVRLFQVAEIPWVDLAFRVIHDVMLTYSKDVETGVFPFRIMDVEPRTID
jgi:ADP-ribose pyrophosphatase YjhB (NUDIX family)